MTSYLYDDGNGLRTSARVEPSLNKPITDVSNMVKTKSGLWMPQTGTEDGAANVQLAGSDIQVPTQMQAQLTPQDKVLTAYSVGMGATAMVTVIPVDGFSTLGIDIYASTSHSHKTTMWAMPDGATQTGSLQIVDASTRGRNMMQDSPSNYVGLEIVNNHSAAVTYDVWVRKFNR